MGSHGGDGVGCADTGLAAGVPVDASAFKEVERFGKGGTKVPGWQESTLSTRLTLSDGPVMARYVKLHLNDIYFSATLIDVWEAHEPGLEADEVVFDSMREGEATPVPIALELKNTSKVDVQIEGVTLDSDAFELRGSGSTTIPAGGTDASCRWCRKPGLRWGRTGRLPRLLSGCGNRGYRAHAQHSGDDRGLPGGRQRFRRC